MTIFKHLILRICQFCLIAFPFALNVIFYQSGVMDDLVFFLPIFVGLTLMNYFSCRKTPCFVLMQSFMIICIIISRNISSDLYFNNISDDPMTPVVGEMFLYLEAGIAIIATAIIAWSKARHNPNKA